MGMMEIISLCAVLFGSYFVTTGVNCNPVSLDVFPDTLYEMYSRAVITCYVEQVFNKEIIPNIDLWKDGQVIVRNDRIEDPDLHNSTRVDVDFTTSYHPIFYPYRARLQVSLSSVRRNDTGRYHCSSNHSDITGANNTVYQTEPLFVMVRYYPDPICSPPMIIQKGAETTVSCSLLEGTNEPVAVQWTASSPVVNLTAVSRDVIARANGFVTSSLTLITTDTDINGELHCKVSNRYMSKNCLIPIKTIWPSLYVHPAELSARIDSEAVFTCAFQLPVNSDLTCEWHSAPPIEPSRTDHLPSSTSTFTISKLSTQDNGTTISCLALFSDRWIQADAKLYVRDGKISAITTSIPSDAFSDGGRSIGWKAGFSIVFIMMLVATGAVVFLFWRLRPRGLRELFTQSIDRGKSETKIARHSFKAESAPGDTYTDLQNPSNTENNVQPDTTGDTYMDLLQAPAEETHGGGSRKNYGADTDDLYVNEVADERPDDSIYEFAENDYEEEQVYTNQQVIGSRYIKR